MAHLHLKLKLFLFSLFSSLLPAASPIYNIFYASWLFFSVPRICPGFCRGSCFFLGIIRFTGSRALQVWIPPDGCLSIFQRGFPLPIYPGRGAILGTILGISFPAYLCLFSFFTSYTSFCLLSLCPGFLCQGFPCPGYGMAYGNMPPAGSRIPQGDPLIPYIYGTS